MAEREPLLLRVRTPFSLFDPSTLEHGSEYASIRTSIDETFVVVDCVVTCPTHQSHLARMDVLYRGKLFRTRWYVDGDDWLPDLVRFGFVEEIA